MKFPVLYNYGESIVPVRINKSSAVLGCDHTATVVSGGEEGNGSKSSSSSLAEKKRT
jgi:hypothetical protein